MVALESREALVAIDDNAARRLAKGLAIRLTGTLGCATKGAEDQWMRVPPEEVSVHLGSYLGGELG